MNMLFIQTFAPVTQFDGSGNGTDCTETELLLLKKESRISGSFFPFHPFSLRPINFVHLCENDGPENCPRSKNQQGRGLIMRFRF